MPGFQLWIKNTILVSSSDTKPVDVKPTNTEGQSYLLKEIHV